MASENRPRHARYSFILSITFKRFLSGNNLNLEICVIVILVICYVEDVNELGNFAGSGYVNYSPPAGTKKKQSTPI